MCDDRTNCDRFDQWLLEASTALAHTEWGDHLSGCARCRTQWRAHRALAAAFAGADVPELSPAFEAGLDRALRYPVVVRPLRGWRTAVMVGYGIAALAVLRWALMDVPLPTIDPSAPWVAAAAFAAVPLTLMLAIAASRWIPARGMTAGPRLLAL